ncbi:hypothetical protein ACIBF1_44780 [Spirillospora sp. NPDC050679]
MAYLVLPGTLDPHDRLVAAHRIVDRSRHGGPGEAEEVYARLRDQVLRRAVRHPERPRRLAAGGASRLGPWLRARPAAPGADDLALTAALAALSPQARAAYALRHLEGLPEGAVRERLAALDAADPDASLREAASVDERVPPETRDQLLARPTLDPTVARLHVRLNGRAGHPGRRAGAVAAIVALAVAGGAVVLTGGLGEARVPGAAADRVTTTPAGAWRRTTSLDLDAWPARGGLAGDRDLAREALRAWNGDVEATASGGAGTAPPVRDPQLLYAGRLGDHRIVLLHDTDRVARYTAGSGDRTLEVFPEGRALPGGASPLKLAAGRYLLPPWVTGFRVARLGGRARWKDVPVRGGVTDPVPAAPDAGSRAGGCWRGPVFELRQPEIAHGRPYTMADLGGLQSANLLYQPPPPARVRRLGPHQIDSAPEAEPEGFGLWGRLGCAPSAPTALDRRGRGDVESATAWEFWRGDLPDQGGRGRWVCTRYAYGGGRSTTYTTLLDGRGRALATGRRDDTWDCSRLQRDVASGTWWRSPKGRWHYLAAASRRVTVLTADGPFEGRPSVRGGLLQARGPAVGQAPDGKVALSAADHEQRPVPVFQADPG